MKKELKYLYLSDHLKKEAMKIFKSKWSKHTTMEEMNFYVEIDNVTGLQKKIIFEAADGPKELRKLLSLG